MTAVPTPHQFTPRSLQLALAAALVVGVAGRLSYGYGAPFWFDETFSGVIASQPSFAKLLDWCLNELTGPAYYMPLWAWAKLAGPSDLALRLPSVVLALAAPLLILWKGAGDREVRTYWAILCLLWAPAFAASWDARGYAQLFFLGAAQAMLLLRLIERPSPGRAAAWAAGSAAMLLTHYWSAIGCAVQGAAFLAVRRREALRSWSAALLFLPVAAWAWFHLPVVLSVTGGAGGGGPDVRAVLAELPESLFGIPAVGVVVAGTILLSLVRYRSVSGLLAERVLAGCGLASVAGVVALACVKTGFAPRYLTPAIPSFLFAVAVWLRWVAARDIRFAVAVLATMGASGAGVIAVDILHPERDARHMFELERPSAWLAERQPQRLVFFWDGAVAERSSAAHLAEVGGFFFNRAGRTLPVEIVRVGAGEDPNRVVTARAWGDGAILWVANEPLPASRAPHPERYDPHLECRDFGGGQVTLTACRRR